MRLAPSFLALLLCCGSTTLAAPLSVADQVVSYNDTNVPTTFGGDPYNISSAALGLITADTTFGSLTPFNAAFDRNQLTGIGNGGSLVLHLSAPIATTGKTLGIHAAVGVVDTAFPNGNTGSVAELYTNPRTANVYVSQSGSVFSFLGNITFDIPSNYFSEGVITPGNPGSQGTVAAEVSQPFPGTLSDFDNKDWPGVLGVLNGSAGGKWLDLSLTGLPEVNFVKFEVVGAGNVMYVDSVVGIAIPEPAGAFALLGCMSIRIRRRK